MYEKKKYKGQDFESKMNKNRLDVHRRERVKEDIQVFSLSPWRDGVAVNQVGEDCDRDVSDKGGEEGVCQELTCGHVKF